MLYELRISQWRWNTFHNNKKKYALRKFINLERRSKYSTISKLKNLNCLSSAVRQNNEQQRDLQKRELFLSYWFFSNAMAPEYKDKRKKKFNPSAQKMKIKWYWTENFCRLTCKLFHYLSSLVRCAKTLEKAGVAMRTHEKSFL